MTDKAEEKERVAADLSKVQEAARQEAERARQQMHEMDARMRAAQGREQAAASARPSL